MNYKVTKVYPGDNLVVALTDLDPDSTVEYQGEEFIIHERVPAKHKFVTEDKQPGDQLFMYGVLVGQRSALFQKVESLPLLM